MTSGFQRVINKLRQQLHNRIAAMAQKVVLDALNETDDDGHQIATVRGLGTHIRRAERIGQAGLTSKPTAGSGIQVAVGGRTDNPVVIALENLAERPTDLADGETTLYNEHDCRIDQKADGTTEIHTGGTVDFVALAAKCLTELNDIRTKFDAHVHITTATTDAGPVATMAVPAPAMGAATSVAADTVKAE